MSRYLLKELVDSSDFPDRVTRTQWTLQAIKVWEKKQRRVKYWQSSVVEDDELQDAFDEKLAAA
jgi:hypothetical protein